jgi:hypothetical protein
MWQQHERLLENYLWGGGFWEESYYIGTAGEVSSQTIEQYIERTEHVSWSLRHSASGSHQYQSPEALWLLSL